MDFECDSDCSTDTSDDSELESDTELDTQMLLDTELCYEPEPDAPIETTKYTVYKTPIEQLNAQLYQDRLAKLHLDIKARACIPTKPTYQKLHRTWPPRAFAVRALPDTVQSPIDYFELLWTMDIWTSLVANTNSYAQYKDARQKGVKTEKKTRWWTPVNLYEMRIFIALLLYMSFTCIDSIDAYWSSETTIHKPMEYMAKSRFQQILRYFHVSDPGEDSKVAKTWYGKLWPLYEVLRKQFQAWAVPGQNVSFDEMMVPYTGRSSHTLKIKNKPIAEGFKVWALASHGWTQDFLFYSRLKSK